MSEWWLAEVQSGYQLRQTGPDGIESIIGVGAYSEVGRQIIEDHNAAPKLREALKKGIAVIGLWPVKAVDATEALRQMRAALKERDDE